MKIAYSKNIHQQKTQERYNILTVSNLHRADTVQHENDMFPKNGS